MDKPNIEYAEGRVISFEDESAIQPSFLEIFTYTGPPAACQLPNE